MDNYKTDNQESKNNLISIKDLNFTYSETKSNSSVNQNTDSFVLKNISLDISEADFISVIGKNGSGKSTLVKLIAGIISGYSGQILINNADINSILRKELSKKLSYL
ncbi:MAG: ABC transporter ATP-binding protein, partial [Ignavibacteria bacterium]|nr:ABC transporter ATP-binding protein [Ignavibacteria bacterium]